MKIASVGFSGLIGQALKEELGKRHELVLLRRPASVESWLGEIEQADAVINLAGEPIAGKRWTTKQKEKIRGSRLESTSVVVECIAQAKSKPKVLINASAIGFYGSRGEEVLDESAGPGQDFLASVCTQWEKEAARAQAFGVRTVFIRTGIVLSTKGGALTKMLPPFKFFLGGPIGSGRQIMSWVHIDDEVGGILKALEDDRISGPLNVTAPHPVTMKEFAKTLGQVLHRPALLPVPAFVMRILLGEMSGLLLTGQNVAPRKLIKYGYQFKFKELGEALRAFMG